MANQAALEIQGSLTSQPPSLLRLRCSPRSPLSPQATLAPQSLSSPRSIPTRLPCSQSNPLQNPWEALEALDNRIWKTRLAGAYTVETIPSLPMISALYILSIAWEVGALHARVS